MFDEDGQTQIRAYPDKIDFNVYSDDSIDGRNMKREEGLGRWVGRWVDGGRRYAATTPMRIPRRRDALSPFNVSRALATALSMFDHDHPSADYVRVVEEGDLRTPYLRRDYKREREKGWIERKRES